MSTSFSYASVPVCGELYGGLDVEPGALRDGGVAVAVGLGVVGTDAAVDGGGVVVVVVDAVAGSDVTALAGDPSTVGAPGSDGARHASVPVVSSAAARATAPSRAAGTDMAAEPTRAGLTAGRVHISRPEVVFCTGARRPMFLPASAAAAPTTSGRSPRIGDREPPGRRVRRRREPLARVATRGGH